MHHLEPYYEWRNLYISSEDELSPYYGAEYSEFEYIGRIYNHYIHPQWDEIGSQNLFIKILFCNYESGFCIIEMLGEWNDTLYNDIMHFKRNVLEVLMGNGINQFIIIGENVLNFHGSDDCYYEEWFEEVEEGWIALVNFREHVLDEMRAMGIDSYLVWGGQINEEAWRTFSPIQLHSKIKVDIQKRLGI